MKRLMIVILLAVFLVGVVAPQPAEAVFLADDVVILGAVYGATLAVTLVVAGIVYFVKAIAGEAPAEQAGQEEAEPPPGQSEREDPSAAPSTSLGDQRCNVLPHTASCR